VHVGPYDQIQLRLSFQIRRLSSIFLHFILTLIGSQLKLVGHAAVPTLSLVSPIFSVSV